MKHLRSISKSPQPASIPVFGQFEQKINTKINTINSKAGSLG